MLKCYCCLVHFGGIDRGLTWLNCVYLFRLVFLIGEEIYTCKHKRDIAIITGNYFFRDLCLFTIYHITEHLTRSVSS